MTATSSTSPRAQRAARRGEASRLQEQLREEQAGKEGVAAQVPADGAAEAGAGETGLREDAATVGPGLTLQVGAFVAAVADSTESGRAPRWPAAGTAAASGNVLVSPAAGRPATMPPPLDEGPSAKEVQGEQRLADSPAPVGAESPPTLEAPVIAAAVAEVVGRQEQPPSERLRRLPLSPPERVQLPWPQACRSTAGRRVILRVPRSLPLSAPPRRGGSRSCAPSQHRGGLEQGWDLGPRDPSWAGFGKSSRHQGKRVCCHLHPSLQRDPAGGSTREGQVRHSTEPGSQVRGLNQRKDRPPPGKQLTEKHGAQREVGESSAVAPKDLGELHSVPVGAPPAIGYETGLRGGLDGAAISTPIDPSTPAGASGGEPLDKDRDETAPL
ncbi:unnamed protein product [Closterium sp. NIES-65]|nr:unnamed protein product [Closterium sp. NIES-65]